MRNWVIFLVVRQNILRSLFLIWPTGCITPPHPPPLENYKVLMSCQIVALNKLPGVHLVVIREIPYCALAKIIMRSEVDQSKTDYR